MPVSGIRDSTNVIQAEVELREEDTKFKKRLKVVVASARNPARFAEMKMEIIGKN